MVYKSVKSSEIIMSHQKGARMADNIRLLYHINKRQLQTSLRHLCLFMRYSRFVDVQYGYTIEQAGKYIVLHDPESGDMCHLHNHPVIVKAMQQYDIQPHQYIMFDE